MGSAYNVLWQPLIRPLREAGSQPESNKKPKSQPETNVDAGTELEEASPVATPPMVSDAISRGKRKMQVDPRCGAAGCGFGRARIPLVIAGVDEAAELSESSASHLAGSSARDIRSVDAKFQRLLETVHENRPGG